MLAQLSEYIPTINLGHHHVKDNDLGNRDLYQSGDFIGILTPHEPVPCAGCVTLHQLQRIGIIVHREHSELIECGQDQQNFKACLSIDPLKVPPAHSSQFTCHLEACPLIFREGQIGRASCRERV